MTAQVKNKGPFVPFFERFQNKAKEELSPFPELMDSAYARLRHHGFEVSLGTMRDKYAVVQIELFLGLKATVCLLGLSSLTMSVAIS